MGYCPLSMGLGAGQAWQQAGRARGWACWAHRQAQGRGHGAQGAAAGWGAGQRAGRWRPARAGTQAGGRGARARQACGSGAGACGRWRARGRAAGQEGARLSARGTAGRQHGRAACARKLGQLGQVGVFCTLTQFFLARFDSVVS